MTLDEYSVMLKKVLADETDSLVKSMSYEFGINAKNDEAYKALLVANNSAMNLITNVTNDIGNEYSAPRVSFEELMKEVNEET